MCEIAGFDDFSQPDSLALFVRHLDTDGRLASHALDEDAFSFQRQAEIVLKSSDAAVLDASFRLKLKSGHDRAGIDLRHLPAHIELGTLCHQHFSQMLQL